MASTGIISGNTNGLRTSEVCNPFHYVLTLDLCNNAPYNVIVKPHCCRIHSRTACRVHNANETSSACLTSGRATA
ncbi:MAG: hypothetical protein E5299_00446 [Burkholderia gladioli]|nr:MAG: hypothetical protein E5299_00446 [Burkholderia gladioli]